MARLNAPYASYPIMKQNFKWAVIKDIYTDNDTADIEIIDKDYNTTGEIYEKVPIFYHCEPNANKRANGALENAASGFEIDDKVLVRFEDETPLIVGRLDGLKSCASFKMGIVTNNLDIYELNIKNDNWTCKKITNHPFKNLIVPNMYWNQEDFTVDGRTYTLINRESVDDGSKKIMVYDYNTKTIAINLEIGLLNDNNNNMFYTVKHSDDWRRIIIVKYDYYNSGSYRNLSIESWVYDYDTESKQWVLSTHYEDEKLNPQRAQDNGNYNNVSNQRGMRIYVDINGNVYHRVMYGDEYGIFKVYNVFSRRWIDVMVDSRSQCLFTYKNEMITEIAGAAEEGSKAYCDECSWESCRWHVVDNRFSINGTYANLSKYISEFYRQSIERTTVNCSCNNECVSCEDAACNGIWNTAGFDVDFPCTPCNAANIAVINANGNDSYSAYGATWNISSSENTSFIFNTDFRGLVGFRTETDSPPQLKGYSAISTILPKNNDEWDTVHFKMPESYPDSAKLKIFKGTQDITDKILNCKIEGTNQTLNITNVDDLNCLVCLNNK